MWISEMFGFGKEKIKAQNKTVVGRITAVKRLWWIKVNTKAVRRNTMDGATFPHVVYFVYSVDGKAYQGSKYLPASVLPPAITQSITVYYDEVYPTRYTT